MRWVDEGLPIAYQVLDDGVPVYASGGELVGTVDHVVSAPSEDIFHGIAMSAGGSRRFVAADQVASLHEHGVDLRIDAAAVAGLRNRMVERRRCATATRGQAEPLDAHPGSDERSECAPARLDRG